MLEKNGFTMRLMVVVFIAYTWYNGFTWGVQL